MHLFLWKQRGLVVRASGLQSAVSECKFLPDREPEFFVGYSQFNSLAVLADSQIICLPTVGILSTCLIIYMYLSGRLGTYY